MSEKNLMGEDYLLATHAALMEFAPQLKHHVEGILRQREAASEGSSPAKSIHPKFLVNLGASEAQAIVTALKLIEENEGYDKTFNNRQITVMLAAWSWHAQRLKQQNPDSPSRESDL
jgi:hypothetical protein